MQNLGCYARLASPVPVDECSREALKLRLMLQMAQDGLWLDRRPASGNFTRLD